MPNERDSFRASDADREQVAERLRTALNEGRLTLSEYDERVQQTYAARTYGDLKGLLSDLPDVATTSHSQLMPTSSSVSPPMAVPVPGAGHTRHWLAGVWSSWLTVSAILIAIWIATGDGIHDFWPIWVIGPWGAILLATTATGLLRGEPQRQALRRAHRHAERQAERERRRDQE